MSERSPHVPAARARFAVPVVGARRHARPVVVRPGRAAGHLEAGRRERPDDPGPAVVGVPHRRHRRRARVRGRPLLRDPLQGPRPADPRAVARQRADRVHVHRHPGRAAGGDRRIHGQHDVRAQQDRRHAVRDQRHRPAVVVGVRLPGRRRRVDLRLHAEQRRGTDRHQRPDGDPHQHQRADPRHEPRRHPLVLGAAPQRQARHGARAASTRGGSKPASPASTPASAPSSAGSATPTCAWRSWPSTRPTSRSGSTTNSSRTRHPDEGTLAAEGEADVHRQLLAMPSGRRA